MRPSTPFKLDLLSTSKYGTPTTGARCNDAQRYWSTSDAATRKVAAGLLFSYLPAPSPQEI